MTLIIFCSWLAATEILVPRLKAQESVALIMLAASLLVFRTFRERYLLVWIVGWLAYFVSRWTVSDPIADSAGYLTAISEAEFVLAVCLFAAAVFIYSHAQKLLAPLLIIAVSLVTYSAVRVLLWPDSIILRLALEIAYRMVACVAVFQVIRFRWARWEIGPWLLSFSLLMLHLNWTPITFHMPPGSGLIATVLAGLSMLLLVFDDYKMRTRRLAVVNTLTGSITRAQQHGPMMATALEELKLLMGAKAAWFRLLEGDRMVITQQIGLSPTAVRE